MKKAGRIKTKAKKKYKEVLAKALVRLQDVNAERPFSMEEERALAIYETKVKIEKERDEALAKLKEQSQS